MPAKLITAPTDEPVTLDEVKQHLRIVDDDTSQDAWLLGRIKATRQEAEERTRRAFITQRWALYLDRFPRAHLSRGDGPALFWGRYGAQIEAEAIKLPRPPVQTVVSVQYYDLAGTQQTLDPSLYALDSITEPARLLPAPNTCWPETYWRANAVTITLDCGYGGDPDDVPGPIKDWILLRLGTKNENREDVVAEPRVVPALLDFADHLLDPYLVLSF